MSWKNPNMGIYTRNLNEQHKTSIGKKKEPFRANRLIGRLVRCPTPACINFLDKNMTRNKNVWPGVFWLANLLLSRQHSFRKMTVTSSPSIRLGRASYSCEALSKKKIIVVVESNLDVILIENYCSNQTPVPFGSCHVSIQISINLWPSISLYSMIVKHFFFWQ